LIQFQLAEPEDYLFYLSPVGDDLDVAVIPDPVQICAWEYLYAQVGAQFQ
jgi:hypothetical protein